MRSNCLGLLPTAIMLFLAIPSPAAAPATAGNTRGDDSRVRDGYQHLLDLKLDKAVASFTPPLMDTLRQPLTDPANRKRAARYLVLIGRAFMLDDNEPAALHVLTAARDFDPENMLAAGYLAESLAKVGRHRDAEKIYQSLEPFAGKDRIATRALAIRAMKAAAGTDGVSLLEDCLKLDPTDRYSRMILARATSIQGLNDIPAREAQKAAEEEESPYIKQLWLSFAAELAGKQGGSKAHLMQAAKLAPHDPAWHGRLGFVHVSEYKGDQARAEFVKAAQCPRLSTRVFTQLSAFLAYHDEPQQALRCLEYIGRLRPYSHEIPLARAAVYESLKQPDKAEAEYQRSLVLNPYNLNTYRSLGRLYATAGNNQKYLANYQQCTKNCPRSWQAWRYLGEGHRRLGQWALSQDAYKRAEKLATLDTNELNEQARGAIARIHSGIGMSEYKQDHRDQALECARTFNQLKVIPPPRANLDFVLLRPKRITWKYSHPPTNAEKARENVALADMLYEEKDLKAACDEYRKAIKLDPENVDWHMCFFSTLMEKGDWVEALKEDFILANKLVGKAPQAVHEWHKQFGKMKEQAGQMSQPGS